MIPEIPEGFLSEIKAFTTNLDLYLDQDPGDKGTILAANRTRYVSMVLDYLEF
jgi:hypothetical protein